MGENVGQHRTARASLRDALVAYAQFTLRENARLEHADNVVDETFILNLAAKKLDQQVVVDRVEEPRKVHFEHELNLIVVQMPTQIYNDVMTPPCRTEPVGTVMKERFLDSL